MYCVRESRVDGASGLRSPTVRTRRAGSVGGRGLQRLCLFPLVTEHNTDPCRHHVPDALLSQRAQLLITADYSILSSSGLLFS